MDMIDNYLKNVRLNSLNAFQNITLAILRPKPDDQNNFNSKMGGGAIVSDIFCC